MKQVCNGIHEARCDVPEITSKFHEAEQRVVQAAMALEQDWTKVRRFEAQALIDAVIEAAAALRVVNEGQAAE